MIRCQTDAIFTKIALRQNLHNSPVVQHRPGLYYDTRYVTWPIIYYATLCYIII